MLMRVLLLEVDSESQREHFVDVQVLLFTVGLHVEEQLVFRGQSLVPFYMIDKLFVAELSESLEVNSI